MNWVTLLDGLRGYFLLFMMLNHLNAEMPLRLASINHANLSFVEDAQGFIFLSGMLVGTVQGRRFVTGRGAEARRKLFGRARELYAYAAALLAVILTLAAAMPFLRDTWGAQLGLLTGPAPGMPTVSAFALLYQPRNMDILPQYILYLTISPFLLRLVAEGRWYRVAAGSALLWLAVQTGMTAALIEPAEAWAARLVPGLVFRSDGFDPLAWQIVWVTGLLIGAAFANGTLRQQRFLRPERAELAWIALALVLFFLAWRVIGKFGLGTDDMYHALGRLTDRVEFSVVYVLNFAALGYLVAWLLVAGAGAASPFARIASLVLRAVFGARFLVWLGQHSLQVYAYHVIVIYLVAALSRLTGGLGEVAATAVAIGALLSLAVPAWVHERLSTTRSTARPSRVSLGRAP